MLNGVLNILFLGTMRNIGRESLWSEESAKRERCQNSTSGGRSRPSQSRSGKSSEIFEVYHTYFLIRYSIVVSLALVLLGSVRSFSSTINHQLSDFIFFRKFTCCTLLWSENNYFLSWFYWAYFVVFGFWDHDHKKLWRTWERKDQTDFFWKRRVGRMVRNSALVLIASQRGPLLSNGSYISTVMCLVELFMLWVFDVTNAKNIISYILLLTINSLTISQTGTFFIHMYVYTTGIVAD